jgi:methionyl-tRNA formyltransferase
MKVVFMGTPDFGVPSLCALHEAHEVIAVYTQPDRVRGRGSTPAPSPVKTTAAELGLPVFQPVSLTAQADIDTLRHLGPDTICVAAYGMLLPPEILSIPPYGCLNVHASLLPAYRGAAPVHWAILNGDAETGVVIMQMETGLDTGAFTNGNRVAVDDHTVESLTAVLAERGAAALLLTLEQLETGTVSWTEQDDSLATRAPKVTAADLALEPVLTVDEALRRVRASTPSARSRACVEGRTITVLSARAATQHVPQCGVEVTRDALLLGCADGAIHLDQVRPVGRSAMDGACFARGARLAPTCAWSGES